MLLPAMLLVVFYFLLIRPQNKRAKDQREMLSKVAAGDEIATTGGVLGKVIEVGDQFLTLEIASGVNIKLQKFQVSQVLPKGTVKTHDFLPALEDRAGRDRPARGFLMALPNVFGEENACSWRAIVPPCGDRVAVESCSRTKGLRRPVRSSSRAA